MSDKKYARQTLISLDNSRVYATFATPKRETRLAIGN